MKQMILNLLFISAAMGLQRLDPLVDTKKGLIRGIQVSDGDYAMFLGIPYAEVNRSNPFGASQPYPLFDDVFEAFDDSTKCPQIDRITREITGSLDCLRLNIFVPSKATTRNKLPVLLYIHGGAFQAGGSSHRVYGPKYLVRNDVILVTMNYRIGVYGFMCLDTDEVPGNQGLKDQLIALKWLKDNIEAFGGDPNKVTIVGQSAGGVSVEFHILFTKEKLFDKAISQSGTSFCPWVIEENDKEAAIKIAQVLGFDTKDNTDALTFLATVEPNLVNAAALDLALTFSPCVEKEFINVERFITEHPVNVDVPKAKSIPLLIGYTSNEMMFYSKRSEESYVNSDIFYENLTMVFNLEGHRELARLVQQYYIGDEDLSIDLEPEVTDFESDFTFNYPAYRSVQRYLDNAGKLYHYIFSYTGGRNYGKVRFNLSDEGVAHSDELGYLFDISLFTEAPSDEDQLVIDRITTLWSNFAKHGDPTPQTSDLIPVKWTPASKDLLHYMDIDKELVMKRRPFHDRMAFWDLFYKMNIKLLKGYKEE